MNSKNKGEANFKLRLAGGELEYEVEGEEHIPNRDSEGDIISFTINKKGKRNLAQFGVAVYQKKNYSVNYKVISDPYNISQSISNFATNYISKGHSSYFIESSSVAVNLPIPGTNIITNESKIITTDNSKNPPNNKITNTIFHVITNITYKTETITYTNQGGDVEYRTYWTNNFTNIYLKESIEDTKITTTLPSSITKKSIQDGLNKIFKQSVMSWTELQTVALKM